MGIFDTSIQDNRSLDPIDRIIETSVNKKIVNDIADTMMSVPSSLNVELFSRYKSAASFLRNPINKSYESSFLPSDENETLEFVDTVMRARNNAIIVIRRANELYFQSQQLLSENPFIRITEINSSRTDFSPIDISNGDADNLVDAMNSLLDTVYTSGRGFLGSQISSVDALLDGLGGSGDAILDVVDLATTLAGRNTLFGVSDFLIDFESKKPKMLFNVEYRVNGIRAGTIVCWKKMADASGYKIKRKNLFSTEEKINVLNNFDLEEHRQNIGQYVESWILNLYEQYDLSNVSMFLDTDIHEDSFYLYSVSAYQKKKKIWSSAFNSDYRFVSLSNIQKNEVLNYITNNPTINPYSAVSKYILGDASYGWILAGVNVSRYLTTALLNDDAIINAGYMDVSIDYIFSLIDTGFFVAPIDVASIVSRVLDSFKVYGYTQTMSDIFFNTGSALKFSDVGVPRSFLGIQSINDFDPRQNALLKAIFSATDIDSLVIDKAALSYNLHEIISKAYNVTTSVHSESYREDFSNEEFIDVMKESGIRLIFDILNKELIEIVRR